MTLVQSTILAGRVVYREHLVTQVGEDPRGNFRDGLHEQDASVPVVSVTRVVSIELRAAQTKGIGHRRTVWMWATNVNSVALGTTVPPIRIRGPDAPNAGGVTTSPEYGLTLCAVAI
jgi:hypothetical protein